MSVFRIEKNANYTVMSNYHLKDRRMSLKAKGLLSLMLSLPDDWDYSQRGLIAICKENETAIKNTLRELQELGYLSVLKERTDRGTFEYVYNIFEKPQGKKPEVENLGVDKLGVENQGQLNTKELNTKKTTLTQKNTAPLDMLPQNSKSVNPSSYREPKGYIEPISNNTIEPKATIEQGMYQEPIGYSAAGQERLNFKEGAEQQEEPQEQIYFAADSELNTAFCEFINMRKTIGKPVASRRALEDIKKDLKTFSDCDRNKAIEILYQSVKNSWCSLRPLETPKKVPKTKESILEKWGLTDDQV